MPVTACRMLTWHFPAIPGLLTLVQEMVDQGMLDKEQARSHPRKNVITRAVGLERRIRSDIFRIDFRAGDTLLLCSDGLSNVVPEDEITAVLLDSPDAEAACRDLLDLALSRGAPDNVSMIVWKR